MNNEDEFTVQDHRSGASETGETQRTNKPATQGRTQAGSEARERRQDPGPDHDLDFSTFAISLASSAQVNLGAMPHPETNQTAQNFPAAKQMIDILTMLQTKTKGNLTESEAALLEQVLFSLRMHYVRVVEGQKKPAGDNKTRRTAFLNYFFFVAFFFAAFFFTAFFMVPPHRVPHAIVPHPLSNPAVLSQQE